MIQKPGFIQLDFWQAKSGLIGNGIYIGGNGFHSSWYAQIYADEPCICLKNVGLMTPWTSCLPGNSLKEYSVIFTTSFYGMNLKI